MARLFISYKREEQAYAFALRQWLIDTQDWPPHEVFVDRDKLHAGDAWADKIFREAEACEAMLFLASDASLRPDSFCYKELHRARGITIAVTLGGLSPDDQRLQSALPHGANARQIAALDGQPTAAFEYVSPIDGKHGAVSLNRTQVESIGQTLRELGIAPNSFTWKVTSEGPYRGLGALQEGDEALFFGREREVRDCIRALEEIRESVTDRALVIQAPSGAGKSSLLRAGLWRRLRRHAAFSPLAIVRTRHGVLSNEEWGLAAGLARPEANLLNLPLSTLEDRVAQDLPRLLAELADADASAIGGRRTMLLGIDQAEEMAALATPQESDELRRLFAALAQTAGALDLRLVLTARDDSIDATLHRLAASEIAQEAVRTFRLHRMPPSRFKDVIEKPARVASVSGFPLQIDDALATALAEATAQSQGAFSDALPILALALQRLVRKRRTPAGTIMAEPDSAARLVSEAVVEATKEALEAAAADEAVLRRLMIPRLVTWDPRAGEGGAAKRRMATEAELFAGDRASLKPLADALVDQRLLTRAGENYEVSHEALLRVAPLGALILELRNKFLRADMLRMEAQDWVEYGRRTEWVARTGERLVDAQKLMSDDDFGPMLAAPQLGIADYLAACVARDAADRELREQYDRYQLASLTGAAQGQRGLREVNVTYPADAVPRGNGAKIYISYSRRDAMASEMIRDGLGQAGFEVLIDRLEILPGEEWQSRVEQMITQADKVVYLLSPDSASSRVCQRDVELAESSGKVVVPVLVRDTPPSEIPGAIAKLNVVFMRDESERERSMPALLNVLATDIEWVREQTRLNDRATAWRRSGKRAEHLLRGSALVAAERWRGAQPGSASPPSAVLQEFIAASRMGTTRRQRYLIAAALAIAVASSGVTGVAFYQREAANEQRALAETQRARAEALMAETAKLRKRLEEAEQRLQQLGVSGPTYPR